jgi:hypothetical protein
VGQRTDHSPSASIRLPIGGSSCRNSASPEIPPERVALRVRARNNALMPGRSHTPTTKPVVVLRKRPRPTSAVPPAGTPTVAKPPPVVTAARATSTGSSPVVESPRTAPEHTTARKPPSRPEDPARVAARRAERIAAIQAVLTGLMDRWPRTFSPHPLPVRPLATGIGQVIAGQLPGSPRRSCIRPLATGNGSARPPIYRH